jgi:hypothetical protein
MTLFSRTRSELILGLWALAPGLGLPALILYWHHRIMEGRAHLLALDATFVPLTAWMLIALFAFSFIWLVATVLIIRDVWRRPMPTVLRKLWTAVILLAAPYGALAYWFMSCHGSSRPAIAVAEAA